MVIVNGNGPKRNAFASVLCAPRKRKKVKHSVRNPYALEKEKAEEYGRRSVRSKLPILAKLALNLVQTLDAKKAETPYQN